MEMLRSGMLSGDCGTDENEEGEVSENGNGEDRPMASLGGVW